MRTLTKEDFKAKKTKESMKEVPFDELGGVVYLKKLAVKDAQQFQKDGISNIQRGNEMIAKSVCDESGNPIWDNAEEVDEAQLDYYEELSDEILKFNNLNKRSQKETEKNS
jgi:hypothetical protein